MRETAKVKEMKKDMDRIKVDKDIFYIETACSCYVFAIAQGVAEHLYYGARIPFNDIGALREKRSVILVNTLYPEDEPTYSFDCKGFEFSLPGRGDSRSSQVCLNCDDVPFDFVYDGYDLSPPPADSPMPVPVKYDASLCVRFVDRTHKGVTFNCRYLISYDEDVIVRYCELVNGGKSDIDILKFDSSQTDMRSENKKIVTFCGAWGREMSRVSEKLVAGKYTFGSYSGMSSAECNPLFFIADENADEDDKEVYGFNLMYSASHEISAEVTPYGGLRILHGIQSENLKYNLKSGGKFVSPCSLVTYSANGFGKASRNFHDFMNKAVIGRKKIPVMLNTWEAVYFDMDENKMRSLADKAAECGFECLVIDDGWFRGRNDDTTSLGDWYEDKKKFPSGLKSLSEYFAEKGLKTGIWIEPEMISTESDLYRAHPDYALKKEGLRKIVGRGQYILDLTDERVQKHVEDSVARLVEDYGASYVKWDFNRRFADTRAGKGSGYFYDYTCSLYGILARLKKRFPDLIIENCASGGGRFDLGMAYYTACGWASDNTDPLSRAEIQLGASYGYPLSFTLGHVAASPGHQTMRPSALTDRINTAFLGVFGVQADITRMTDGEIGELKKAIAAYKEGREDLARSDFFRIMTGENGYRVVETLTKDKKRGYLYLMREKFESDTQLPAIRLKGLDKDIVYRITGNKTDVSASGETLMNAGLVLAQNYQGAGTTPDTLTLTAGSTLLLKIIAKE